MSQSSSSECLMEKLRAAVIDGRTENVRYRQTELHKLHKFITTNASALCEATIKDSSCTSTEAETELLLATTAVRDFYKELDFTHALAEEYAVAHGKDNTSRRMGYGIVVIRPTSHTRVFSILVPLAAAISAGNCVLLELPTSMRSIDAVLGEGLHVALDRDTFGVFKGTLADNLLGEDCLLVDQAGETNTTTSSLSSGTKARAVAIVDRTADIDQAAKAITYARFRYQGNSPYSPDLVLVNEFVKDAFTEACLKYTGTFFSSGGKPSSGANRSDSKADIELAEKNGDLTAFGSSNYQLAHITNRNSQILRGKVTGCIIPILSITGLVDIVQLSMGKSKLLASYIFASQPTGKFLAQHLDSHLTCINQIPLHLLVGPAAPLDAPPSFTHRYTTDMMSTSRPQYITIPSPQLKLVAEGLESASKFGGIWDSKLRKLATEPLPPTGQKPGHAIGFFEQGVLTGAAVLFLPVVGAIGYGSFLSAKYIWRTQLSKFL